MNWKDTYEKAYGAALQQYKSGKIGKALDTMENSINSIFAIISGIQNEDKQEDEATEASIKIKEVLWKFHEESKSEWKVENQQALQYEYSVSNKMINQNNQLMSNIEIAISQTYVLLGLKLLETFANFSEIGKTGISIVDNGIKLIDSSTISPGVSGCMKRREQKELINSYKARMAHTIADTSKRRFNEYWAAHQLEKAQLETEKQSLKEQIAALNNEISTIPQNTDGYDYMIELQQKVQSLILEKNALGFFKFKDKKTLKVQIDSVKSEIAPIQLRINSAIDEVKKRISTPENRINAIDTELTKPR